MHPFLIVLLISLPPILISLALGLNAKKLNAQWRAKRDAKLAARNTR